MKRAGDRRALLPAGRRHWVQMGQRGEMALIDRCQRLLWAWALAVAACGCAQDRPDFGWPRLFGPGPADRQQQRAVRFDPYPQDNGGPSLTGVRPREYEKPIPEIDRARWQQSSLQ